MTFHASGAARTSSRCRAISLKRLIYLVERWLQRHRLSITLFVSVFLKAWDASQISPNVPAAALLVSTCRSPWRAHAPCDAEAALEPLSRATAIPFGHAPKAMDRARRRQRKSINDDIAIGHRQVDAARTLENALRISADGGHLQGHQLMQSESALAHVYSARGQYTQATAAMERAVLAAQRSGDKQTLAMSTLAYAQLELKHHRYAAAGVHFEDILRNGGGRSSTAIRTVSFCGLGWTALMEGDLSRAGSNLGRVLQSGGRIEVAETCSAQHDGLDACRAIAMAGLGIIHVREGSDARSAASCSSSILSGLRPDDGGLNGHCTVPQARRALGLVYLALGQASKARQQYKQALYREREQAHAWPGEDDDARRNHHPVALAEDSDPCGNADLALCSHTALGLGLIEFASGDKEQGIGYVRKLVSASRQSAAAEVAEWLQRYAQSLQPYLGHVPRIMTFPKLGLSELAAPLRP